MVIRAGFRMTGNEEPLNKLDHDIHAFDSGERGIEMEMANSQFNFNGFKP
jgi:hypothetical protein